MSNLEVKAPGRANTRSDGGRVVAENRSRKPEGSLFCGVCVGLRTGVGPQGPSEAGHCWLQSPLLVDEGLTPGSFACPALTQRWSS